MTWKQRENNKFLYYIDIIDVWFLNLSPLTLKDNLFTSSLIYLIKAAKRLFYLPNTPSNQPPSSFPPHLLPSVLDVYSPSEHLYCTVNLI